MEEASQDLREKGNALFKEGRYADAREQYTEALKHDPSVAVVYSNRSATHAKLQNFELALLDAQKCIQLKPQWPKGFIRKILALEGLRRHEEIMQSACEGFRFAGEDRMKRELVGYWLKANRIVNRLPEGSIELPTGIMVLSKDYLQVLSCIIRSLDGECPLSLELTEQCLLSCAEQVEKSLKDFSEPASPVIMEWAKHLPHEVYPYSVKPVAKADLERQMKSRSESFISYLNNDVDPTLYPLIRPIMGLVVLVVLNRSNILTECNSGHHSVELMNRAILPLFESSILSTGDYYSLYIGRLCAVLDSFIGRGYKLDDKDITTVRNCYAKLQLAVKNYPTHLPGCHNDKLLAERTLSNVTNNILQPASPSPSAIPMSSVMSVELAERLVNEKPQEVKAYLEKHLKDLQSVIFLSMGEVEELLTMTGIFHELGMKTAAVNVFRRGEQAFFDVLGHMLSSHTLKLDQCPATIAPMRQLVLSEATILNDQQLLADVILRWKCLFKELRARLITHGIDSSFGEFFQWYLRHKTSTITSDDTQVALLKQLQEEEKLLQQSAKTVLRDMSKCSYAEIQQNLPERTILIDYIFFVPLKECPLMEAYCVVVNSTEGPVIYGLDYNIIHRQAAMVTKLLQFQTGDLGRVNSELTLLARSLFPQPVMEQLTSGRIDRLYISPDTDITLIPFDSLPVNVGSRKAVPLFELFSVSILSSMRKLLPGNRGADQLPRNDKCVLIGNPNYNLTKPDDESYGVGKLVNFLCDYFNISATTAGPIVEQLKYSQDEVDSISHCLQSHGFTTQLLDGDSATLTNILSLDGPLMIHVSTHAYAGSRQRMAFRGSFFDDLNCAAIALTGFNTFCKGNFSKLPPDCGTAQLPPLAILSMKLQGTRVVFLSTCNSASGTSPIQEAVDSLAEAFLTAGVETVIAFLWPVADQSAAEISKEFYSKLVTPGTRPSEALAHVKKHFKKQDDNYYWSSYTALACYGTDKPLRDLIQ